MSLYKENRYLDFFKNKTIWIVVGIIIVIAVLGYLTTLINWSEFLQKDNINLKFKDSPLILSEKENTLLEITLKNNTENDLDNLEVKIKSVENSFIIYCPDSKDIHPSKVIIPKVAKGNKRIVTCDVRYDSSKDFFEGTYSFDVDYYIQDLVYSKRITLAVKR
jgi:preprotein translocase subunit SecF